MTSEAKFWTILNEIDNALAIIPSGELVFLDVREIEKFIKRKEHEQILEKLAKDFKLFEIKQKPDYKLEFNYGLLITDIESFREALNNAHIKHFGSLEMLVGENLLAVVDISADIFNKLQMTPSNKVIVPLLPSMVRFRELMPGDGINLRDRYCDFRWRALEYLKNNDYIKNFTIIDKYSLHRWEYEIEVLIDRIQFTKFYEKLMGVYKKRVKFPNKETESKTAATIPEPPTQKIEIVKGKLEVDGLGDGLKAIAQSMKETNEQKFPYKLPAGTKWEEIRGR